MRVANAAADLKPQSRCVLRVGAVEPPADFEERSDSLAVSEDELVRTLQYQTQAAGVQRSGRERAGPVGFDLQEQTVGLDRHGQPAASGGRYDLGKGARGRHRHRDAGPQRRRAVHRMDQRAGAEAHGAPEREAIVHSDPQIGIEAGQYRGHVRLDAVLSGGSLTFAVRQRDPGHGLAEREVGSEGGSPHVAAQQATHRRRRIGNRSPGPRHSFPGPSCCCADEASSALPLGIPAARSAGASPWESERVPFAGDASSAVASRASSAPSIRMTPVPGTAYSASASRRRPQPRRADGRGRNASARRVRPPPETPRYDRIPGASPPVLAPSAAGCLQW